MKSDPFRPHLPPIIVSYSATIWCLGLPNARSRSLIPAQRLSIVLSHILWLRLAGSVSCFRSIMCLSSAMIVYCGNISAVYMTANLVHHRRTKHIEIDIHFIRDKVALGQVRVLHVPSTQQFADIMMKGLSVQLFTDFRSSLCVRDPPASTTGGY